jgi:hypothetical protein
MEEFFSMKGVFDCRQNNDKLMGFALFYFSITGLEYFVGDQAGDVCNFSVFEIWGDSTFAGKNSKLSLFCF